jgi:hypothetical protein
MFRCGMNFQSIPLHIVYNFQHFERIEYFNGLFWYLFIFQMNDPKVHRNLNDFPSFSKLMMPKPHIQFS